MEGKAFAHGAESRIRTNCHPERSEGSFLGPIVQVARTQKDPSLRSG